MAASTYICQRVQEALATYLAAQTWTVTPNIYKGIQAPEREWDEVDQLKPDRMLPCVVCICQGAKQDPPYSNNWIAECTVNVYNSADDATQDDFHAMVGEVMDALYTSSIAADLSAARADFTAFLLVPDRQDWDIEERTWRASFGFALHCCAADVS